LLARAENQRQIDKVSNSIFAARLKLS